MGGGGRISCAGVWRVVRVEVGVVVEGMLEVSKGSKWELSGWAEEWMRG